MLHYLAQVNPVQLALLLSAVVGYRYRNRIARAMRRTIL